MLYIFEDNEAVIKMIIKGRSPTMRHVSRTHRVALDWLFDRINLDPMIQIKYIDTKSQLADILTKGNFTRDEWNHLLCLFNISHFSSINKCKAMSKRTQEENASEERVTAKSKPMTNLVSRCRVRDQTVLASTASENPGDTKSESQNVPLSPLMCSKQVRGDPYWALAHQTPQSGTMTTSGLLMMRENDTDGRVAVLMVTGYAQGPLCQMITEYDVNSHAHDALPTTGKMRCTEGLK